MKRLLLATSCVAILGSACSASAADLAARPYTKAPAVIATVYDWSGFYIGINGGWGESGDHRTFDTVPTFFGDYKANGGTFGGQVGYRWQSAGWVFGLEAQGNWADFHGSSANLFVPGASIRSKLDAFGLFTGQVGYAWNNVLGYVKGGAVITDNTYESFFTATGVVFNQTSETRWGGAVGTGVEIGFASNWSVAFEYDHLFMGRKAISFPASNIAVGRSDDIAQGVDMGTVRLNYRFGGPVVAKY
jgi:outer membrane immunogenic protein